MDTKICNISSMAGRKIRRFIITEGFINSCYGSNGSNTLLNRNHILDNDVAITHQFMRNFIWSSMFQHNVDGIGNFLEIPKSFILDGSLIWSSSSAKSPKTIVAAFMADNLSVVFVKMNCKVPHIALQIHKRSWMGSSCLYFWQSVKPL